MHTWGEYFEKWIIPLHQINEMFLLMWWEDWYDIKVIFKKYKDLLEIFVESSYIYPDNREKTDYNHQDGQ